MRQATVAPEPGECAFNDPAPPYNFKTALLVRALDDLQANPLRGQIRGKFVTLITAIGKDMFDEGEQAARLFDRSAAAFGSWMFAGITSMPRRRPMVPASALRLMPLTFLPESYPTGSRLRPPFLLPLPLACR